MVAVSTVSAVMMPRAFARLEDNDRRGPEIRLPHWHLPRRRALDLTSAKTVHPLWRLVTKELHLQQMSLVVAGVLVVGWIAMVTSRQLVIEAMDDAFSVGTFLFGFLLALLIGSLASAEERRLGTLEWQVILPVATSTQWAVKVATAVGLAIVIALGLPALLGSITLAMYPGMGTGSGPDVARLEVVVPIILFTTGSLYVSSLCATGIQALLISAAALPVVALFVQMVLEPLESRLFVWASDQVGAFPALGLRPGDTRFPTALALCLGAGFVLVMLRFAMVNHRSAERGAGRVWKQLLWLAVCLLIGVTIWAVLAGAVR